MPIQRVDLPKVAEEYHSMAQAISHKNLSRNDLQYTGINQHDDGRIIWDLPHKGEKFLSGLNLLVRVDQLPAIEGVNTQITRANVITVARLGSFAARQTYENSQQRSIRIAEPLLSFMHDVFESTSGKLEAAFTPIARPTKPDKAALFHLSSLLRILQERH